MYIEKHRVTRNLVNQKILAGCMFHKLNEQNNPWQGRQKRTEANLQYNEVLNLNDSRAIQQELMRTVDTVIDAYRSFCNTYNQDADPHQKLSVTAPCLSTEQIVGQRGQKVKPLFVYRGRVSSRRWSLVVGSSGLQIEFLLIPTAKLLRLSSQEKIAEPFFVLKAYERDNEICWLLKDSSITKTQIANVYQEAFRAFIEVVFTDGDDETELFSLESHLESELVMDQDQSISSWIIKEVKEELNCNIALPSELPPDADSKSRIRALAAQCPLSSEEIISTVVKLSSLIKANDPAQDSPTLAAIETASAIDTSVDATITASEESSGLFHFISRSLEDWIEETETQLATSAVHGSQVFELGLLEEVELELKEAQRLKIVLERLLAVKSQCLEFQSADMFVRMCQTESGGAVSRPDQTFYYCEAGHQLRIVTEQLLNALISLGAEAFKQLDIERTKQANQHAQTIKKLQIEIADALLGWTQ